MNREDSNQGQFKACLILVSILADVANILLLLYSEKAGKKQQENSENIFFIGLFFTRPGP